MHINVLEQIELKYNFEYPKLYKQLCEDGMLNTGKYGGNWYNQNYDRIKDNPIFLIWSGEVEILEDSYSEIESNITDLRDQGMWSVKPELVIIPFAANGAGDLYCFYYNEQVGEDIPIVILYHDEDIMTILAKNLQDFTFYILLQTAASSFYSKPPNLEEIENRIFNINSMYKSHKKYLTEEQIKILDDIYSKEFKPQSKYHWGMISEREMNEIKDNKLNFPLFKKDIIYYAQQ